MIITIQLQYLWRLSVPDSITNTFTTKVATAKTLDEKAIITKEKLEFDKALKCHEKTRTFILEFIRNLFVASTTNHHILIDAFFNSADKPQPGETPRHKSQPRKLIMKMNALIYSLPPTKSMHTEDLETCWGIYFNFFNG